MGEVHKQITSDGTRDEAAPASPGEGIFETVHETVAAREFCAGAMVALRCDPADDALMETLESVLGLPVALSPCTFTTSDEGTRQILWLGPDEWLIVDAAGDSATIIDAVYQAAPSAHVACVDVSANRVIIELEGADARDVLEKGCLADLHPGAFAPGRVIGTVIARCQVFLQQWDDAPVTYRLYVRPSFAPHLAAWLEDAMMEFAT